MRRKSKPRAHANVKKKPIQYEAIHQKAYFEWLALQYPLQYRMTWHTPNGGSRHALEAVKLKLQGVKRGVPDIFMAWPCGDYHGLFLELKHGKNELSEYQHIMMKQLSELGYYCEVSYDIEHSMLVTTNYIRGNI